ncbi:efflux transporter outer membrane subunit [Aquabacterium sp.]|uniref:efflux transporter outer membrane subunit n=1 Tax=Aquabacterium sp. TaxID=1872578 RepID=UPI0025C00496|nr:efflux transporter outer membrane subunit [Aquabacterium sp.]
MTIRSPLSSTWCVPAGARTLALPLAAALLLGGCATPTAYQRTDVQVPERFAQSAQSAQAEADAAARQALSPWWLTLNDASLTALINDALARNNNLAQAALKVRRAQLVAAQAGSDQLPSLAVRGSSTASQALDGGPTTRLNSVTGTVTWEADLWGRLASLRSAADWEAQATEQDRIAAAQALVATTANLYFQVSFLNQRVDASQQSIGYARRTLQLVQAQYDSGSTSGLELSQAQQALAAQEAAHTQFLLQRVQARNALAILLDGPPGVALNEAQRLPDGSLPEVPAGVPSELLARRPDVRASELRLRKSLAQVDATRTSYYPALTLTGSVGGSSTALSKVLSDPIGTLGAGLVLPFVQFRDMQRNIAISQTDYESAVIGWRQSWYSALSDVDNALASRLQYEQQGLRLQDAVTAARNTERLAEVRYRAGAVPLKTWLDAQETRRQAEINLAQSRLNRLNAMVTLYQVLGGDVPAPQVAVKG